MKPWIVVFTSTLISALAGAAEPGLSPANVAQPVPSAAALQAGEAPRWNPPAAETNEPGPLPNAAEGATSLAGAPAEQALTQQSAALPTTEGPRDDAAHIARPLVSVLKNKADATPPATEAPANLQVGPRADAGTEAADATAGLPKVDTPMVDAHVTPAQATAPAAEPLYGSRYQDQFPGFVPSATSVPTVTGPATGAGSAPGAEATTGTAQATPESIRPLPTSGAEAELPPPANATRSVVSDSANGSDSTGSGGLSDAEKAASRAANDLLASSLGASENRTSLSLLEILAKAPDSSRAEAVKAYWEFAKAASCYHWALDELDRLEQIVPASRSVDSPMLSTARAAATARVSDAKLGYQAATIGLLKIVEPYRNVESHDYYPADKPLVGPYHTHFALIFANRVAPGNLQQIHECLPTGLEVINQRAAAVQSAASAVHAAEQSHGRGNADIQTVLACHEALHEQRKAFLDAVVRYNADIADYAIAVAAPGTPSERIVQMLIRTKQPEQLSSLPNIGTHPAAPRQATPRQAAPSRVSLGPPKGVGRAHPSDGWVPSRVHPLEAVVEPAASPSARSSPPVATPNRAAARGDGNSVGDRYGNGQ